MDERTETDTKTKRKRIDLSVPQVAGSALAAAVAAFLAGRLGVYGTIIGAGVVSVVATTGGSIFQHLFRRTGEQLKEATVVATTRPKPRRSSDSHSRSTTRGARSAGPTKVLPTFDKQGAPDELTSVAARTPGPGTDRTQLIPRAEHAHRRDPAGAHPASPANDATPLVTRLDERSPLSPVPHRPAEAPAAAYGTADLQEVSSTTYGTRLRGWKRPALGALAVFVLAMGALTATELITGETPSGNKGTTLGQLTTGGGADRHQPGTPHAPGPGHSTGNGTGGGRPSPDPSGSGRNGGGTPSPTPTPSDGGKTSPDPDRSPSGSPSPSHSGTSGDSGGADEGAIQQSQ